MKRVILTIQVEDDTPVPPGVDPEKPVVHYMKDITEDSPIDNLRVNDLSETGLEFARCLLRARVAVRRKVVAVP